MRATAFLAVSLLLAGIARPCLGEVPATAIEELRAGRPEAAEKSFAELQKAFEDGRVAEYALLDSFKPFYAEDAKVAAGLDRWVTTFPKSSSAFLARGTYYRKRGDSRRGKNYVAKTPSADLAYMSAMFAKSRPDLETALELNPKSYLAALGLLNIAHYEGDNRLADRAIGLATAIYPANTIARARYTAHLTPRWGGSYERIDAFIEHCRSTGVPAENLALLQAIKLDDQGQVVAERGQQKEAIPFFERALSLSKAGGPRFRKDYLSTTLTFCSYYRFGGDLCS